MAGKRADQHRGDEFGRRLAVIGDGRRALRRVERRAVEVFADDPRRARSAVEDGANLVFEQRALLLDDDDELEPAGEVAHDDRVERPNHADFEEPEAKSGAVVGDAEIAERLQEILPGLAGCDDADPRVRALADDAIEAVGARIGERGRQLMIVEPLLLRNRRGRRPARLTPRADGSAVRG